MAEGEAVLAAVMILNELVEDLEVDQAASKFFHRLDCLSELCQVLHVLKLIHIDG